MALVVVSDPATIARSPEKFVQRCCLFPTSETHTITYNLGDRWLVGTDIILIDLVSYHREENGKWTCNTPSDRTSLCRENLPLFYVSLVLERVREIFCKPESTWGKIGSLRLTKVHDPGK